MSSTSSQTSGDGSRIYQSHLSAVSAEKAIRYTIPHRQNQHHKGQSDKQIYRKLNIVERLINRPKQFQRIATRYEKRAANIGATVTRASIFLFF